MIENHTQRAKFKHAWRRQSLIVRRYFRIHSPKMLASRAIATLNHLSLRTALITVTLLLIASITIAVLTAIALARDTPSWWRDANLNTPQAQDLARRVEIAIVEHVHKPRTNTEAWRVSVNVEQANAWLNTKLPAWVESRDLEWPDKVTQVQADFNDGVITLGARLNKDVASQIVAASFQLEVRDDGALWIKQPRARAGRLDLPNGWTVARLREWLPPELAESEAMNQVLLALAGEAPLFEQARLKLGDGRIVRTIRITSSDDQLLIESITERPPAIAERNKRDPELAPGLTPKLMADAVVDPNTPDDPREKAAAPRR